MALHAAAQGEVDWIDRYACPPPLLAAGGRLTINELMIAFWGILAQHPYVSHQLFTVKRKRWEKYFPERRFFVRLYVGSVRNLAVFFVFSTLFVIRLTLLGTVCDWPKGP